MAHRIIPIIPAESLIPEGDYCYRPDTSPAAAEAYQRGRFRIVRCPFWILRSDLAEQANGYCSYLKLGDWMEDGTFLLWDQVKECGVKLGDDEEQFDWTASAIITGRMAAARAAA